MIHAATRSRGDIWAHALPDDAIDIPGYPASLRVVDGAIGKEAWRAIAVVPDPHARFVRARSGELGLDEGPAIAEAVRSAAADAAILAVVDVPGQAFGAREEAGGIQLALAAAVEAYATERRAGRQIFALLAGKAISGAFLAHGLQAGWIGALDDSGVEVHVMPAASVARITRSSAEEVARVASIVPATARDIRTFAAFGAIDALFPVQDASAPSLAEIAVVRAAFSRARAGNLGARTPRERLATPAARENRAHAIDVRKRITAWWNEP
ncbi:MAG: biotin-independent malonate decarboxylase subunit gamma [Candidatus Velthaea sp.]